MRITLASVLDMVGWDWRFNEKTIITDSQNVRTVRYLGSHVRANKVGCRKVANLLHSHAGDKWQG